MNNTTSNADQNDAIRTAIDLFDVAHARILLRDALHTANGETYYLASLVALNDRQKRDFLQKAVDADPFHAEAVAALEQLNNPAPGAPTVVQQHISPVKAESTIAQEPILLGSEPTTEAKLFNPANASASATQANFDSNSIMADSMPTQPVDVGRSVVAVAPAGVSDTRNPTPAGGTSIQSLAKSAIKALPKGDDDEMGYVKGIVQQDTPLYVVPERRGTIRAQLLAFAEVILLTRTDDSRWVNVIWLSSINKETLGWLPLATIRNGYVQGNMVNLIDLPISQFEFSDMAHLIEIQGLLQQDKWDRLRRSVNLVAILFGTAFCSFFLIDALVGTRLPIDYLSLLVGAALILFGLGRWWMSTAAIRQKWQALDAILRHKHAVDDSVIAQQANKAALKLASEMVVSMMRAESESRE